MKMTRGLPFLAIFLYYWPVMTVYERGFFLQLKVYKRGTVLPKWYTKG